MNGIPSLSDILEDIGTQTRPPASFLMVMVLRGYEPAAKIMSVSRSRLSSSKIKTISPF